MNAAPAGAADGAGAAPCVEAVTASPSSRSAAQGERSSGTPGEVGTSGLVAAEQPGRASDKPAMSGSPPAPQPLADSGADSSTSESSSGDDEADTTPPAVTVELGTEISELVAALCSGDALAAGRRVAELAAGERDEPKDEAACAALLAADAVAALCAPVTALLGGEAAARDAACASLRALCSLTDCHPPAREAVAAAGSGWLPALCALVQADPSDDLLVDLALHVLQYTSRGGAAVYARGRRGAYEANLARSAGICTLMCDVGVPSVVVQCLRRVVAAGVKTAPAPAPAKAPQQELGVNAEEGSQQRVLLSAIWCISNVCLSSLPPSCLDDRRGAHINNNATIMYDAGAAVVLTALLGTRPLVVDRHIFPWLSQAMRALTWLVEMHSARNAATTRNAIASLLALLDPLLYGIAAGEAASHEKDDDVFEAVVYALDALDDICTRNEACCDVMSDTGGIRVVLELFKAEHLTSKPQRQWIFSAADVLHRVLPQSAACRRAFLAAGGFTAPVALLQAAARVAYATRKSAVTAASILYASTAMLASPEILDAICSSGAVRALCDLMHDYPGPVCSALWSICEDKPAAAALVRDCGGVAVVASVLREISEDPEDTQDWVCDAATGLLMTLSNYDALAVVIAEEKLLEPLAFIVRETNMEDARLYALLAVSCVYSGRAEKDADALLAERDITRHLTRMLDAVLHHSERLYLKCSWSEREVANYVRLAAVDTAAARRLVGHGVVPLLLKLLARTADAAVQQHVCRALLTLSYEPVARTALLTADAAAAVARFEAVADGYTADAAKGLVRRLADGGADGDSVGTAAAAAAQTSFRVFLSHKRTDAKDFARALHTFFKNENVSAFLDYEFREDLHDLQAVISRCDNLVFILTENIFESYWCRVELCAAVRAGVNVILVRKEGVFWTCAVTGIRGEHPPESLINGLPLDEDVAYKTKQMLLTHKSVSHSDEYYSGFTALLLQKLVPPDKAAAARALAATVAGPRALPAGPTGHSTLSHSISLPLPSHASANQAAAAPHASLGTSAHVDALQLEVLTLRAELAALRCAPAAARDGGGAHMPLMLALLGGTVAVVGVAGCVAIVAIVAAAKQQRAR